MLGREKQIATVEAFWRQAVEARTGGALYMYGKPGSGKTATIHQVSHDVAVWEDATGAVPANVALINSMLFTRPRLLAAEVH